MDKKVKAMIRMLTQVALCAALMSIVAPFSIPLPGLVPISLATFMIYLCGAVMGAKNATLGVLLYIALGVCGLPVFAGGAAGAALLVSPSGGYLIGYLFLAFFTGLFSEHFENRPYMYTIGMVIGTALLYSLGTIWLAQLMKLSFGSALLAGVIPFIPGDAIKIISATALGYTIKKRVKSAGYLG